MGYALLGIENLIVWLLFVATVLACIGRLHRRWLRSILWLLVVSILLLAYMALTIFTAFLHFQKVSVVGWFWCTLILTVFFLVGCIWLVRSGLRQDDQESAPTVAGTWPRGKLAIALGVAVALHLMTFWNIDLAARQQLEALRGEAGALALSVAPSRVSDRDNAAIVYEQAFEGLFPMNSREKALKEKWKRWTNPGETGLDVKEPDLRQFLQSNAGRIALLNKAATKPGCYFEHDYHWPTFAMPLPEIQLCGRSAP